MHRWHAFTRLVLLRFRDFYRQPEVICWTYGFPLIMTVALGIAFAGSRPEPPAVDVQGETSDSRVRALAETLRWAGMKVEINSKTESRLRYRTGKIALVVVPEGERTNQGSNDEGLLFVLDETRSESAQARKWVEAALLRERLGSAALPTREESIQEPGSRYI
jgi:ABC-2 type transport system permease protein